MIYHVCTQQEWLSALSAGFYEAASLTSEGFIHASSLDQVPSVLQRYYAGKENLILLNIDETLLSTTIKYELALSVNEHFPHIYGRINIDAVVKTTPI